MRFSTQKAALCSALLDGRILTIMDAFTEFGITNLPREIGRSIEREFGIYIKKRRVAHINKYGEPSSHFAYWLPKRLTWRAWDDRNKLKIHKAGLILMRKYVDEHSYPERIIMPSKKTRTHSQEKMPPDHYAPKTWPGFPEDQIAAYHAREAEKRSIHKNTKTTKEIVEEYVRMTGKHFPHPIKRKKK